MQQVHGAGVKSNERPSLGQYFIDFRVAKYAGFCIMKVLQHIKQQKTEDD